MEQSLKLNWWAPLIIGNQLRWKGQTMATTFAILILETGVMNTNILLTDRCGAITNLVHFQSTKMAL
jgi:hypothetical protein